MLPHWEQLTYDDAVRDIAISHLPCNWLQCQENSVDPVHTEWLHFYFGNYVRNGVAAPPESQPKTMKIAFDAFEYGIIKRRLQLGFPEDGEDWAKGHPIMFPNILFVGRPGPHHHAVARAHRRREHLPRVLLRLPREARHPRAAAGRRGLPLRAAL